MEDLARTVERAVRGDEVACRELYRQFRPAVLRLARSFAWLDEDEVEDVVQESFARAFRHLRSLKRPAAFEPWLLTIVRNRALTYAERRSMARRALKEMQLEPLEVAVPIRPPSVQLEADVALVRRFIDELPEGPEKETVRLFYLEGELSARELAERLGVGKSAITMRLERFRARVKKELLRRLLAARWE